MDEILERGVSEVIGADRLLEQLKAGKKLRVKLGIDPTSANIHIGRAVVLWKLRAFQDLGHTAVLIVGDFTGLIGDTSDKDSERPMLSEEQVQENQKTYFEQAFKILDKSKTETEHNSKWLKKLGFAEIGRLADMFGLHEFEARENIAKRLKEGKRVSLRELLYPLMQGYDSVAVKADVELGGTDQRFNLLAGRTIQPKYDQEPQSIVTTELMEGTDGRKMSSSWGNVINITDEPNDMFGKVMSIKDDLIIKYFTLATRVPLAEVKVLAEELGVKNPRDIKMRLASEIVTLYHGEKAAQKASEEFQKVFSKGDLPEDLAEFSGAGKSILDFLAEYSLADSRSEAKRLLEQSAVRVNSSLVTEWGHLLSKGDVVQVGPRKFAKVS